jgi:hypothetical protein
VYTQRKDQVRNQQKVATNKLGEDASVGLCWHFDFGLLAFRTVRKLILLSKPPHLWYFVRAALAN